MKKLEYPHPCPMFLKLQCCIPDYCIRVCFQASQIQELTRWKIMTIFFFFWSFEQHSSKRAPQNGCHRLSTISRDFNLLLLNFCSCTRPTFVIYARDGDWDNGKDLDCPFRLCQGVYASHFNGRQTYANNQIGLALTSFAWADREVIHLSRMKIFNYCCLILGKDLQGNFSSKKQYPVGVNKIPNGKN